MSLRSANYFSFHSAAVMDKGGWLLIKSPMIIDPAVSCGILSQFLHALLQDRITGPPAVALKVIYMSFKSRAKLLPFLPVMVSTSIFDISPSRYSTSHMSDLPSLSNNHSPQTLASHVKDGRECSLLWAWNFPTPDVITLPSSFEEDGTWSNMEVAGCSFATAASPWLPKRKLRREKHWRLSSNALVCFSSQSPFWQTWQGIYMVDLQQSCHLLPDKSLIKYSTESIWWSLHYHLTYLIDFSISSHRHHLLLMTFPL